jgi:hypothetical protein
MLFNDLKLRARALFKPGKVERELDDELAFHIACETQKLVAGGLSAAEARQRALARFGSLPLAADQCRDQRRIAFFETLTRDIGFAMRTFRRAPLVALTVVSTIALGLGVAAVAFTFFNAFFFQVDAVRHPDELFSVERLERPGSRNEVPFSRSEYEAIRRETHVFTDVAAARPSFPTRVDGRAAVGMFVSGNFFDVLGVSAARGRTLTESDEESGGAAVVVLSHQGWESCSDSIPPSSDGRSCSMAIRTRLPASCRKVFGGCASRRRTIGLRWRSSINSGRGKRGTGDGSTSSDG